MNPTQEGATLRTLVANRILQHMLRHLEETDIEPDLLCKLSRAFCELRKQDIAAEKNTAAIDIARIKAAAKPTKKDVDGCDEDAPYGRKPDGTPHTRAEFMEALNESLKDIYGLSLDDKPDPPPGFYHPATDAPATRFDRHNPEPGRRDSTPKPPQHTTRSANPDTRGPP